MSTPNNTQPKREGLTPEEWSEFLYNLQQLDRWQLFLLNLRLRWLIFKHQLERGRDWLNLFWTTLPGKLAALAMGGLLGYLCWAVAR